MKKMKRFCVVCGKELEIILDNDDDNLKIVNNSKTAIGFSRALCG